MRTSAGSGNTLESSEKQFLQQVARQRVTTYDGHTWEYFDCGKQSTAARARSVSTTNKGDGAPLPPPLVCIPGTSGSARCFHLQMLALAEKGCRVIAVQHPTVWSHDEWIHSFDRFLNAIHVQEVHIYGVSLGAYLAQVKIYVACPHELSVYRLSQHLCHRDTPRTIRSAWRRWP